MKRILITGKDSYIGTSVERRLKQRGGYTVDTVDMQDPDWRGKSFAGYDAVLHVAGIAHTDTGKISEEQRRLYYAVNTELTAETAAKAKADGVKQFIFMSSIIVYGDSAPIGKQKMITPDTQPAPANVYGDSKLQAEKRLLALSDDTFKVVILRPPMIYGRNSKGNYPQLSRFAQKLPFFPCVQNQRSMLYIGNFTAFVQLIIDNGEAGIFFPQNADYTNTSQMVKTIGAVHGKKVRLVKGVTPLLRLLSHVTGLVNKAFGNLCYEQRMSEYKTDYRLFSLEESIRETESAE